MPPKRRKRDPEPSAAERLAAPGADAGDLSHALSRAVIAGVPILGPAAAELFGFVLAPSYQRRLTEWMNEVGERIQKLEADNAGLKERLGANEAFISTASDAARSAARTHQPEKRKALRNAVLNAAIDAEPDDSVQSIFIQLVDRFTPWHLSVLKYFENPHAWYETRGLAEPSVYMGGYDAAFDPVFPKLVANPGMRDQVIRDLKDAGLADIPSGTMSEQGVWASRTSAWGNRFLRFIEDPVP